MSKHTPLPIIVVGTGHHFQRNLVPVITKLEKNEIVELLSTVDILGYGEKGSANERRHIKRNHQPIHTQLMEYKKQKPLVILGHTNSLHAKDASDLLTHGFNVAIEKPYAHTQKAFEQVLKATKKSTCSFLEYYLTMKSAPLLHGFGHVQKGSFYHTESLFVPLPGLQRYAKTVLGFKNQIPKIIGKIVSVEVDVLEGEGETGTLDGRGVDTIDVKTGGGMILCMMIHALSPLVALEKNIGALAKAKDMKVQKARCAEYVEMAKKRFALPLERIAETYAEVTFQTSKKIPVVARVGKYVLDEENRRGIRIRGEKGEVYLDWNSCELRVNGEPVIGMQKDYYPVIRAAIAEVKKEPLFVFDPSTVLVHSQNIVFDIQKIASANTEDVCYPRHTEPADIFTSIHEDENQKVGEEMLRPEDNHNTWLGIMGTELPEFFPLLERVHTGCPGCASEDVESEFIKLGFIYKWCRDCFSLYVSPRPSEDAVNVFYRESRAMRFYGDTIFKGTLQARHQHQIIPLADWVKSSLPKRVKKNAKIFDFMPKFFSVWSEVLSSRSTSSVSVVDAVHLYKLPQNATVATLQKAKKQKYDFITAFDVLEHRSSPNDTIKMLSQLCEKDGLLFLTVNAGGFEYQVLSQDSHRLVPPNRLNLLTVESITHLLTKNNFELVNVTSSGKLDVDIVLKALADNQSRSVARFFSYLLQKRGPEVSDSLQSFLQEHNLSSFVRIVARKKK